MTTATIHDHADTLRAACRCEPDGPARTQLRRRLLWLLWLLWQDGGR
jgi:hypothetical protein